MSRRRKGMLVLATGIALAALYGLACLALHRASPHASLDAVPEPAADTWPPGFLWGTATAAHQVEGGNVHSDWARFETEPGRVRGGEGSGLAAGHWERVAEDVALMRALGANAYRFSLEWSRLEPRPGVWDEASWDHYAAEVAALAAAGITPVVTLLHFTLPSWLAAGGGATAADFPARFGRFAGEAARRLGGRVDRWCTINEPNVQMVLGYVEGVWPPGVRDRARAAAAFAGLLRGHAAAAAAVRAADPGARLGPVVHLITFEPAHPLWLPDALAARGVAAAFNWAFLDSVIAGRARLTFPGFPRLDNPVPGLAGSADFVGINYYRRERVRFDPRSPRRVSLSPGPGERSDLGWEIYPPGLAGLLSQAWERYRLPLLVTETGIADAAGTRRPAFIRDHARALAAALAAGIPVEGVFHWSLVDNFEWAEGFAPKFGLYRVDRRTLDRTPAPGSEEFLRLAPRQRARPRE